MIRLKQYAKWAAQDLPIIHFNSTIIRLKPHPRFSHSCRSITYFNSTMIRLKPGEVPAELPPGITFQFHNDSIKTVKSLIGAGGIVYDFNSTMIRLKQHLQPL